MEDMTSKLADEEHMQLSLQVKVNDQPFAVKLSLSEYLTHAGSPNS